MKKKMVLLSVVATGLMAAAPVGKGSPGDSPFDREYLAAWDRAYSGLDDSSTLTTESLFDGGIVDEQGEPVVGSVVVKVFPPQSVEEKLEVGDQIQLVPVARAHTNQNGRFVVREPRDSKVAASLTRALTADGYANLVVFAYTEKGRGVDIISLTREGSKWRSTRDGGNGLDASRGTVDSVVSAGPALVISVGGPSPDDEPGYPIPEELVPVERGLTGTWVMATWPLREVALTTISNQSRQRALVSYTQGKSSSLGVATSINDIGWTTGSTKSISSTSTVSFGSYNTWGRDYLVRTAFTYQKLMFRDCDLVTGLCLTNYMILPSRFDGGNYSYGIAEKKISAYPNCTDYYAGDVFSRTTGRNVTYSNGVNIDAILGWDLKANTNWDTKMTVRWEFSGNSKLCGTNSTPPSANLIAGFDR